jgi:hypothetical protein
MHDKVYQAPKAETNLAEYLTVGEAAGKAVSRATLGNRIRPES